MTDDSSPPSDGRPGGNHYAENLMVHFHRVESLTAQALKYPSLDLDKRQLSDLELLLNRAFYPLAGYLGREDNFRVLEEMRLADGSLWPMPICLEAPPKLVKKLGVGEKLALRDSEGFLLAVLTVEELWQPDMRQECLALFGGDDPARHPGTARLLACQGQWRLAGRVEGLAMPPHHDFRELRLDPTDAHRRFSVRGWRKVIGHQPRGYLFMDEFVSTLDAARRAGAHLFLQPVVGLTDPGDRHHYCRVRSYQGIMGHYPKNQVELGIIPLALRGAGARDSLWQAMVMRSYGCSHFMVPPGPDGAAHRQTLDLLAKHQEETGIQPVAMEPMAYSRGRGEHVPLGRLEPD